MTVYTVRELIELRETGTPKEVREFMLGDALPDWRGYRGDSITLDATRVLETTASLQELRDAAEDFLRKDNAITRGRLLNALRG